MSLAIDLDTVSRVLLADGWHDVLPGSLTLDAYEMHHSDVGLDDWPASWPLRGGSDSSVPSTGFRFTRAEGGTQVSGPVTSLLALETP